MIFGSYFIPSSPSSSSSSSALVEVVKYGDIVYLLKATLGTIVNDLNILIKLEKYQEINTYFQNKDLEIESVKKAYRRFFHELSTNLITNLATAKERADSFAVNSSAVEIWRQDLDVLRRHCIPYRLVGWLLLSSLLRIYIY